MNPNMMILLPLLMSKNKGGINAELMMQMLCPRGEMQVGGGASGNPMLAMLMNMMCVKSQSANVNQEKKNDPSEFLDSDVMRIIKLYTEMNSKRQSSSV